MNKQTILIVENSEPQGNALLLALEMRGFSVRTASTVEEARSRIAELEEELALMVLDMRLEDPTHPDKTGADLGIELRDSSPRRLPEFLILSAFSILEYYKLAVELRAAAFLEKEDTGVEEVVRHVRALMIKRSLSIDDPKVLEKIAHISDTSDSLSEAAIKFCRDVMSPVLSSFLGSPFVILVSDGHKTSVYQDGIDLTQASRAALQRIDIVLHGRSNTDGLLILDQKVLREIVDGGEDDIAQLSALAGAAFLSVPVGRTIRLSVGVLRGSTGDLAGDPAPLVAVLSRYLPRAVLEPLLCTLRQFIQTKARRDAQLLAHSCSFIAQEQLTILSQALDLEELRPDSVPFRRLMALSEELRDTAQLLMLLESDRQVTPERVGMAALLRAVLEEIGQPGEKTIVTGDCIAAGFKDDLFVACSRILQWFIFRRRTEGMLEDPPSIRISCSSTVDASRITFEDDSPRLSKPLRQRLFSPFAQALPALGFEMEGSALSLPIYLAKSLIELKNGGQLEDRSDELPGDRGQRFVLHLPSPSQN